MNQRSWMAAIVVVVVGLLFAAGQVGRESVQWEYATVLDGTDMADGPQQGTIIWSVGDRSAEFESRALLLGWLHLQDGANPLSPTDYVEMVAATDTIRAAMPKQVSATAILDMAGRLGWECYQMDWGLKNPWWSAHFKRKKQAP